ncbi:hypothetical protein [Bacillus alkalicellulosilyticus]|uniref:hypothetical protein n=1 Tax=Alkalihalobacterium alkalicellulosilyticum TaxID=1912214 RepID=UPI0009972255|nr:hypothetical protein [Bacillus alkalicellulosilyticus]
MNEFCKKLMIAIVAIAVTSTGTSYVFAEEGLDHNSKSHSQGCYHKGMEVHFQMYYQLLAEKYEPQLVTEWDEIRKEKSMLLKEIRAASKRGELDHEDMIEPMWVEKHDKVQQKFYKAVEQRDSKAIKEILPYLFEMQKELNEIFKAKLKSKK